MTILELMNLGLITDTSVMRDEPADASASAESAPEGEGSQQRDKRKEEFRDALKTLGEIGKTLAMAKFRIVRHGNENGAESTSQGQGDLPDVFQDDGWSIYENNSIKGLQHAKGNGQVDVWTIQKDGFLKDESSVSLTEDQFKDAMLGMGFRVGNNGELTIKNKTYKFLNNGVLAVNNGGEFAPADWTEFLDACAETLMQQEREPESEESTPEEPESESTATVVGELPNTTVEGSSNSDQNSQDKWWWDDNSATLGFNPTALTNDGTFEWPDANWLTQHSIGTGEGQHLLKNIRLNVAGVLNLNGHEDLFPAKDPKTATPKAIDTIEFLEAGENTVTSNENIRIDRIQSPEGTLTLNSVTNDNLKVDGTFHGVLNLKGCNFKTLDVSTMAEGAIIQMDAATYDKLNDKNSLSELIQDGKIRVIGMQSQQTSPTNPQTLATPVSASDPNAQPTQGQAAPNPPANTVQQSQTQGSAGVEPQ